MRSTFSGFVTAQLALSSSQNSLNITGQNIANINTRGYTRQKTDQISLNLLNSNQQFNIGYGSLTTGISQVRDPYLDLRYRSEIAEVGDADVKLSGLQELEGIFDEVSKKGLQDEFSSFLTSLQDLSVNVGSKEFEEMVKGSSDSLAKILNQYSDQLETIRNDAENVLNDVDVPQINQILERIAELNTTIERSQIVGSTPLELLDQRNLLLDELGSYMKIDISYVDTEVQPGVTIERLQIDFIGKDGSEMNLVNGKNTGTFNSSVDPAPATITYTSPLGDKLSHNAGIDKINSTLESLFDINDQLDTIFTDIAGETNPDRKAALLLKQESLMNQRNALVDEVEGIVDIEVEPLKVPDTGSLSVSYTKKDGTSIPIVSPNLFDRDTTTGNLTLAGIDIQDDLTTDPLEFSSGSLKASLEMLNSYGENGSTKGIGFYERQLDELAIMLAKTLNDINNVDGGTANDLFTYDPDDPAGSLSIHEDWRNGTHGINASAEDDPLSGANDNILNLIGAINADHTFKTTDTGLPGGEQINSFTGSFHEFFANTSTILGLDIKTTTQTLSNHVAVLGDISSSRASVSGVSLDEEGMNLMQFQKAFTAAAKLMTTLDEALGIILGMGIVGR